jgi:3-deoxy-D-manno-octulosonic-acid transferase
MAQALKERKTPSALFSATFSENSTRKRLISSSLTRTALNSLNRIFCVSQSDAENLEELGVHTPLEIAGDTRFDQVLYRLTHPHPVKQELKPKKQNHQQKIFICGSTWPQDEEVLLSSFSYWIQHQGKIILAPHEVSNTRIKKLKDRLNEMGFSCALYSEASTWEKENILLIDQVGCLQELYTWADLAFVGGSFKDKVHSVMEPLSAGLHVMVGPYHQNNREALQFQYLILQPGLFAVQMIQGAPDIEFVMSRTLQQTRSSHPEILHKVETCTGATARLVVWIRECLRI